MSSEVIAELSRLEHNMMFSSPSLAPPRGPERLVRAGRARMRGAGRAAPVWLRRCHFEWWVLAAQLLSALAPCRGTGADPRRFRSLRPSPSRTSRHRLGEERRSSALSSFSRPSLSAAAPGSLCPPPSVGATSAGTRRRLLLLLPLLPPPSPLPPSPLPLSATISPLPGTGALS